MKFTTPCFVRVEDAKERTELLKWMFDIGYDITRIDKLTLNFNPVIATLGSHVYDCRVFGLQYAKVKHMLDCYSNIELFKALAAMNDENDREQWFINDTYANIGCTMWHLCEEKKFRHYYVGWEDGDTDIRSDFRKATVDEIIEHFKNHRS